MIDTPRLLIRPLKAADAKPLAALWSDPAVTRYMGGPRDAVTVHRQVQEDARAGTIRRLDLWPVVERATGQVIGNCGLTEKEVDGKQEIELVYVFATSAWGKGFATEAAAAIRDHAFRHLAVPGLIALIDPENAASARVAEKVGMHLEGETRRPGGKIMHIYAMSAPATSMEER